MQITTKGQVTIPVSIRQQLGLLPHTEVEFEIDGDSVRLRRAQAGGRGQRLIRQIRGRASVSMTTDEIMSLTRGE